jgi:glutamate-1-semialdehyde 2,1-aminomutase
LNPPDRDLRGHPRDRALASLVVSRLADFQVHFLISRCGFFHPRGPRRPAYHIVLTIPPPFRNQATSPTPTGARFASGILRSFAFDEDKFFCADGASAEIAEKRKAGMNALADSFNKQFPKSLASAETFLDGISDLRFTDTNRVPFPFQKLVREKLNVASLAVSSVGPNIFDLDGNKTLDISGSYGVNVCGYDNYKRWIQEGWEATKELGPVLGPLHPIVGENLAMIKAVSKLDEVSFHMSGTEAIMCAVRLAAFNKRRSLVVCFAGAYHGWWDGVQPGTALGLSQIQAPTFADCPE